jgi:NADPH2:quinone reductase
MSTAKTAERLQMRAIVVEEPGDLAALAIRDDVAVPEPGSDEVRIRVAYAGLNFFDVLQRSGRYLRKPHYPVVLGGEVSGIVESAGAEVHHLTPGQPVCALTGNSGGYADYAIASADAVIPLPHNMSLKLAAAYPLQVLTAWGVLNVSAKAHHPGEWVLVHAAAGGVGTILCQLARDAGNLVIGTAGSDEKCAHAKAHGAQWVINYQTERWPQRVREITGGHGVDIICDGVGKAMVSGNMRCIANFGRVVIFGYVSGEPKYDMKVLWGRSAGITTYGLYHHVLHETITKRSIRETLPRIINGELKLPIGAVYPFVQVAEAHKALEGRQTVGKLLLEINPNLRATR